MSRAPSGLFHIRSFTLVAVMTVIAVGGACSSNGGSQTTKHPRTAGASTAPTKASGPATTATVPPAGPDTVYEHTLVGMLSPAVAGDPARVYVPNSESGTVDVIDPATFTVIDHFATGALPQHVVPAYDLQTLYVNNNRGNTLTPIDPHTGKPGAPIPVDDPYNLYFTLDGTKAVVMAERNSRLDFRDPKTWALVKSIPIAHKGVNHADFTPDGKTMIVSCEFSGWLVRIDVPSMTVTGELDVGGQPIDVRLSPDGKVMYVANQSRNGVSIIDPVALKEVGFIPTGKGAHGLYPSRDAKHLYVTNRLGGSISVIDFATRAVTATWVIGGTPDMGGVSADGTQLWLTGRYSGAVYVVDTKTGTLLKTIAVGRGPHGLAVFPQPGRFSLGHTGNYR